MRAREEVVLSSPDSSLARALAGPPRAVTFPLGATLVEPASPLPFLSPQTPSARSFMVLVLL
eukprot:m.202333 g.202333  ORF g.202333 m.202333 type:complete len:62 (+) comp15512_c0_seq13:1473-1658(+)